MISAPAVTLLSLLVACASEVAPPDGCRLATDQLIATADGAEVALHHHPGRGPAVLLVHGVSSNSRFWDLDVDHSLAVWLAREGFDPWLLDLRGHGRARTRADGAPQISGWTVDDYGQHDVAAAVAWIRAVTGAEELGYVGHSMGGMVGAIYVASGHDDLSAIVMVGSPATFDRSAPLFEPARVALGAAGAGLFWVESGLGGELAAALGPAVPGQLQYRLYNPKNFLPATERRMLRSIASPMSREEMQHFARMLDHERFESADGTRAWTEEFRAVAPPVLAIAGGADEVGRPEFVHPWVEGVTTDARYVEVAGYGHLDLGLGEDAERDVFPHIASWLRDHPAGAGTADSEAGR